VKIENKPQPERDSITMLECSIADSRNEQNNTKAKQTLQKKNTESQNPVSQKTTLPPHRAPWPAALPTPPRSRPSPLPRRPAQKKKVPRTTSCALAPALHPARSARSKRTTQHNTEEPKHIKNTPVRRATGGGGGEQLTAWAAKKVVPASGIVDACRLTRPSRVMRVQSGVERAVIYSLRPAAKNR